MSSNLRKCYNSLVSNLRLPSNLAKNRYTDVLCYDHSRVLLSQSDPEDPTSDYINANYVDGYRQRNAFICTQGEYNHQLIDRVSTVQYGIYKHHYTRVSVLLIDCFPATGSYVVGPTRWGGSTIVRLSSLDRHSD